MAKKILEEKGATSSFKEYNPTYAEAIEAIRILREMKNDSSLKQHYKLKIAAIEAIVKLKFVEQEIEEISAEDERIKEYRSKNSELIEEYVELDANGSAVIYLDRECETVRPAGSKEEGNIFIKYIKPKEEYLEAKKKLEEEYKDALDASKEKPKLLSEQNKKQIDLSSINLPFIGKEYPKEIDGRYLYVLLTFGIADLKE